MKSNSLSFDNFLLTYKGKQLSAPISLQIAGGELLAITGANGSGKSTLLQMLAGLLPMPHGGVTYNGAWPVQPPPVYVGPNLPLKPRMSVLQTVRRGGTLSGHPELVSAAMHYFDLGGIAKLPVRSLSGGWQQRVALTRLITMPSGIWLLDEPTSNLDAEGINLLHALIQTRLEQGGIILIATHQKLEGEKVKTININRLDNNSNFKQAD